MSFQNGQEFSRSYKSSKHLAQALKRNASWNRVYSAEGKAAAEVLEILAFSAVTVGTFAAVGGKVGFLIAGPKGAGVGAAIGAGVGLFGSALVVVWYLRVRHNSDGTVTATFSPA